MATISKIEWTTRTANSQPLPGGTANFWIGCTPCDEACAGCYAWAQDMHRKWTPDGWGKGRPRYKTTGAADNARALHRRGLKAGVPVACFSNSLADFFDEEVPDAWRDEALDLMIKCTGADFLLLTKRARKMRDYMLERHPKGLINVWLGVTAANEHGAKERVPYLMDTPAVRRFISYEPALERVNFAPYLDTGLIHWIIAGGESENFPHPHKARPMPSAWAHSVRLQAWAANVPFYFKQHGEWAEAHEIQDAQARAMCEKGIVENVMIDGARLFKVGKQIAGGKLGGQVFHEMPTYKRAVDLAPLA